MHTGMGKFILSVVDTILARQSQPFIEGEIDEAELASICRCALTAPDHKGLRPWRFILCGPTHKAHLQKLIIEATVAEGETDRAEQAARVARKLGFAPHIVICLLKIDRSGIVPEIEQVLSAGAAIQNMIVAAESLGYCCFLKTGAWAYSASVRARLGLSDDTAITGFLGLGTSASERGLANKTKRPPFGEHFEHFEAWLARVEAQALHVAS